MEEFDDIPLERGRFPVVAGLFYPEEPVKMKARFMAYDLKPGSGGHAAAIIAPHGAWDLSGIIAASAFSAAAGRAAVGKTQITRAVIMGPVHHNSVEGIFLSESRFFATPLGNLPVDLAATKALASCGEPFTVNDIPHLQETSIEVLLPFLYYCFPGISIVPILTGGGEASMMSSLAMGLGQVFGGEMDNTLLIVSANLSLHDDEIKAIEQAKNCIQYLVNRKTPEYLAGLYNGEISACGGSLIGALLQSGLVNGRSVELVSNAMIKARNDWGKTTTYGAIAYT